MNQPTKLLVFSLNDCRCALYLEQVLQIVRAVESTPLPQAPQIVMGAIDLHGTIVPLLNIRGRFGFADRDMAVDDQVIIARTAGRVVAIAVDEVREIVELAADRIVAAEKIVGPLQHVDGVIQLNDGLALIHDLDKFLSLDERRELEHALSEEAIDAR